MCVCMCACMCVFVMRVRVCLYLHEYRNGPRNFMNLVFPKEGKVSTEALCALLNGDVRIELGNAGSTQCRSADAVSKIKKLQRTNLLFPEEISASVRKKWVPRSWTVGALLSCNVSAFTPARAMFLATAVLGIYHMQA
jgi:hypothetical protein